MKTAVWCSTGKRNVSKSTDAEQLDEIKDTGTSFDYMDRMNHKDVLTKRHTIDSFKELGVEPHSYDVIVLENCPINTQMGFIDLDMASTIVQNAMWMLKNNGRLFTRAPIGSGLSFGPFVKDIGFTMGFNGWAGYFVYSGISKNGKYMIYTFDKIDTPSKGGRAKPPVKQAKQAKPAKKCKK